MFNVAGLSSWRGILFIYPAWHLWIMARDCVPVQSVSDYLDYITLACHYRHLPPLHKPVRTRTLSTDMRAVDSDLVAGAPLRVLFLREQRI